MRPEMKYGLITGLGMCGWLLLEYLLGLHSTRLALSAYTQWGTEIILLIGLWVCLRHKLTNPHRYWLPVWQGLLGGLLTSFVAGLVVFIYFSYYLQLINPEWPDLYINWQVALMRAEHVSEDKVLIFARDFRWSVTAPGLVVHLVGFNALFGALASCILTLWLNWRHKEPVQLS